MEFQKILKDTLCDCLKGAVEDNSKLYVRRANKAELKVSDFHSYTDKGREPSNNCVCDDVCSYKGVSITEYSEGEERLEIIKEIMPMSPKYKEYALVIRLKEGAGMVKHTPMKGNDHHYDFYKQDNFDPSSHIELEKALYLPDYV